MQLVITEDIARADGDVRWPRGTVIEYPVGTWKQIAASLKRKLDSFTKTVEEFAAIEAEPSGKRSGGKRR